MFSSSNFLSINLCKLTFSISLSISTNSLDLEYILKIFIFFFNTLFNLIRFEAKLSAAEFDGEHNNILSSLLFLNLKILYAINVDKNVFPVPGGP